jgi:molybdopterin-guanine dinucleotide biosynthesis protein A
VIVAGGGNTRFGGEPKGLRAVSGVRIIDRVATALRRVTDDVILSANANDAEEWLAGVRVVRDARTERGSLIAIHSALTAAAGEDVLIVAWDMPFVTSELLAEIRAKLTGGATAVVPEGPHGLEPFCAAYASSALATIDRAIAIGDLRVSRAVGGLPALVRLGAAEIAAFGPPERLFFNVNNADDLATAEQIARGN